GLAQPLSQVMTRKVVTCSPSETIGVIMERMTAGKFRHVPVIEQDQVVGIVSIGDVVKYRLQEMEHESAALRDYIQSACRWAGENLPRTEASGDLVKRRPGPVLGRRARAADMDESHNALVLLEAERGEHATVIRVPLGDPGRAIAERVRGEHEAHGGCAGRQ